MSGLVKGSEAKVGVVKLEAAMCINPPFIWKLRHDDKARALTEGTVQTAESPQAHVFIDANNSAMCHLNETLNIPVSLRPKLVRWGRCHGTLERVSVV